MNDVGPFPRQILARNGALDDCVVLPLHGKLVRRQMAERAVRTALIVVEPPGFDLRASVLDGGKLVDVETLGAESSLRQTCGKPFLKGIRDNRLDIRQRITT